MSVYQRLTENCQYALRCQELYKGGQSAEGRAPNDMDGTGLSQCRISKRPDRAGLGPFVGGDKRIKRVRSICGGCRRVVVRARTDRLPRTSSLKSRFSDFGNPCEAL